MRRKLSAWIYEQVDISLRLTWYVVLAVNKQTNKIQFDLKNLGNFFGRLTD